MPLSEKRLIRQIRRSARGGKSVVRGIGDDCAVLRVPPGHELLVTTGVTIADVGGELPAPFLSLAVASDVPQKWVNSFLKGLLDLAEEYKVPLAGGDTAQSAGGIQADIVVVGSVPKGKAVLRSGAKAGDRIYVTGELGGSAAALARLGGSKPGGGGDFRHLWTDS